MIHHPSLADLVDHAHTPEVQSHLADCGACRARQLMIGHDPASEGLPGLDEARRALADARRAASLSIGRSWGSDPLADGRGPRFLAVGQRLDRYEVQERIGVGAMGAVYRVEHTTLGSSHALKVVHAASGESRQRLIREGRAQGRLQHANVVPVTDVIDVEGEPGLVMAFVDGPALSSWLAAHGPPPLEVVARLGEQIIRAVGAAHAAGIVHRDLKPSNVLIADTDEGPSARVCDFGLARSVDEREGPGGPLGTPGYMAPEQIRDGSSADARSDLFAVGAVLYELATGSRAFDGHDVGEVWRRIGAGAYVPPEKLRPELPSPMRRTIARARSGDPAERCGDAPAMRASGRGPGARRARLGWAAALAAVGTLGLVAAASWTLGHRGRAAPVADEIVGTDVADRRLTAVGETYQIFAVALSDDDERLLYVDSRGVWLQDVDGGTPQLVVAGGPVHSADWVDDRTAVVSASGEELGGTWLVDLPTGRRTPVSERSGGFVRTAPGAEQVAIAGKEGLWLVDLDDEGERRLRDVPPGHYLAALAWSPDGAHLAAVWATAGERPPRLERIDAATGAATRWLEDPRLVSMGLAAMDWVAPDRLVYAASMDPSGDDRPRSGLYALDDASVVDDTDGADLLRTWEGYQLIRLRVGTDDVIASRGTARSDVWELQPDGELTLRTPEAWNDRPIGWTDDGLLMASDRAGGGLYALQPDGRVDPVHDVEGFVIGAYSAPGGQLLSRFRMGDERAFEVVRVVGDAPPEPVLSRPLTQAKESYVRTEALRCVPSQCLVSHGEEGRLSFQPLDRATGALGEPVAEVATGDRPSVWALSPDASRVTVLLAEPSERIDVDLASGQLTRSPLELDLPLAAAWGPDGRLYVSGANMRSVEPYWVLALGDDGSAERVRSEMTRNVSTMVTGPDGQLAVGTNSFGTDVWWLGLGG